MHAFRVAWATAALLLAITPFTRAIAHEGPEHEIEELTARLAADGETSEVLVDRAIEYVLLGRIPEATRDLERAVQLDPTSLDALREFGRVQFLGGKTDDAVATVTRALALPNEEPVARGGLLILRAEFLRSGDRVRPALDDCNAALRLHRANPEWYLLRSDLQRCLKLGRKRLAGIEEGLTHTGAGILEIERVEALLDERRFRDALKWIEPELESSRIQCRWLIRRARARIGLGQKAAAEGDLRTALNEMDRLLDPTRPDATLLLDQATALALLGDWDAARRVHAMAKERGIDPEMTRRIGDVIER